MTTKQPTIRKGQQTPFVKATRRQIEWRIQAAALLLFCGLEKSQIHRVFRQWFGVEWRQEDIRVQMQLGLSRSQSFLARFTITQYVAATVAVVIFATGFVFGSSRERLHYALGEYA